jgi:hypothetical protein
VEDRAVDRSFNKFTDAAKEAGKSRIYAGIHWSFDSAAGEQLGRKVGQYVADHYFQPLSESEGPLRAAPPPARCSVRAWPSPPTRSGRRAGWSEWT